MDHAQIAVACKLRWPKYTVSIHLLASAMPGGVVLPHRKLMGMCRWMGSHFHDWIDYNGLHFQYLLLQWGRTYLDFFKVLHISVGKRTRTLIVL